MTRDERSADRGEAPLVVNAIRHLDQGIVILDRDRHLVAWSDAFLAMYGYPPAMAYPGADFASFVTYSANVGEYGDGDPDRAARDRLALLFQNRAYQFDHRRPNGAVFRIVGKPLPQGGFLTTFTDVTQELHQRQTLGEQVQQTTAELRLSEERLHLIADEVPAGIAQLDMDMNILYANRRFTRAYGYEPANVVGLNVDKLLHPRTLSESRRFFEQSQRGAVVDFEMRIELPDGRFKDIRTLLRPDKPTPNQMNGFYLVSIDVTRRKATAGALMRSQKMDALGRLASGISHDFNNVLTIILGNLLPLSEKLEDQTMAEEYVQPAISAARRGSSLSKRLLSLARREQLDPHPTDIPEAVREICTLLAASLPSGLEVRQIADQDIPPAFVDRAQLEMALLNLALNARDATDGHGALTIRTSLYALPPDEAGFRHMRAGDYVRISLADDGCGMSAEMIENIFEPFVTSKPDGKGSGLGLSMVYGFVRESNGAIWVESTPGDGTEFTILLPVSATERRVADPAPAIEPLRPTLVLLVDDDLDIRRSLRHPFAQLGHHLVEAGSADEALSLLTQIDSIGAVLTDIEMPGQMDGIALAEQLARTRPDLPVVLMSGNDYPNGSTEQAFPFLAKPFTADMLRTAFSQAANKENAL